MRPSKHAANERAHQMHSLGLRIGCSIDLIKLANLRAGESLDGNRSREATDFGISADSSSHFRTLRRSRGIHPDRRRST